MSHRSSTVIAFIQDVMPSLRELDSQLQKIHYWSDSPTSQYRNKHIFDFVTNHQQTLGIAATWNYFEAGHGKGPCDGLGGTCKRLADEAMRAGKTIIQDAAAFYAWAVNSSMKNVHFRYVPSTACKEVEQAQEKRQPMAIKGTLKVHAVVGLGHSKVSTRETSCYCNTCLEGQTCDSGWQSHKTFSDKPTSSGDNQDNLENESSNMAIDQEPQQPIAQDHIQATERNYVAAVYDGMWYVGVVSDRDETEYEVDFMEMKKGHLQWPCQKDTLWLPYTDILCVIEAPEAMEKPQRSFRLRKNDEEVILKHFNEFETMH